MNTIYRLRFLLDKVEFEIKAVYAFALKRIILDYVLMDPGERARKELAL